MSSLWKPFNGPSNTEGMCDNESLGMCDNESQSRLKSQSQTFGGQPLIDTSYFFHLFVHLWVNVEQDREMVM